MSADGRFQMAVEAPDEWVRVIRVSGTLDGAAAARLLRLVDAQLQLVMTGHRQVTELLIDLEGVNCYQRGGLETLRHARYSTAARGVALHLAGCSSRLHQLPLQVRQLVAEFSNFPTVEVALAVVCRASTTTPATGATTATPVPTAHTRPQTGAHAQPHDGPGDFVARRPESRAPGTAGVLPAPRRPSEPTPTATPASRIRSETAP